MDGTPNIARVGHLIGDNARAQMLTALMHGKALTATELANEAAITAQTATTHLAKLEAGGLLQMRKQGRHKYFALASDEVAALLESIMGFTANMEPLRTVTGPRNAAMRNARVCYNHLAGNKGIQLYDSLIKAKYIVEHDGEPSVSKKGNVFLQDFGIDMPALQTAKSPVCRACLDWSERRTHLAGSLGRALYTQFEKRRWMKRDGDSRIVKLSPNGEKAFDKAFPGR